MAVRRRLPARGHARRLTRTAARAPTPSGNDVTVDEQLRQEITRTRDEVIALAEEEEVRGGRSSPLPNPARSVGHRRTGQASMHCSQSLSVCPHQRIDEYFRRVRAGMQRQMQLPDVRRSLYLTEEDLEAVLDPSSACFHAVPGCAKPLTPRALVPLPGTTAFALRGTEGTRLFLRDPSDTMRDGAQHFEVELRSTAPLAVTLLAERDSGADTPAPGAGAAAAARPGTAERRTAEEEREEDEGAEGFSARGGGRRRSSRIALQEIAPADTAAGAGTGGGAPEQ